MRYLAIDYGNKRTGLAICDRSETIISPLAVIRHGEDVLQRVLRVVREEAVDAIVVGLPLNMDDSEGPQAELVRTFAAKLEARVDIPIHFQDERLSSFAAKEKLAPAEWSWKKTKKHLDAVAAAQILEAFLEDQPH